MIERLVREHNRLGTVPAPTCLCMIDLDHFRRINDVHGHMAGDETLRRFGRLAKSCLREIDLLARWGGEEFLMLLPGTDAAASGQALDRLVQATGLATAWQDCPTLQVTFSAGIAQWRPGETVGQVIERADVQACAAVNSRRSSARKGRNGWICTKPWLRPGTSRPAWPTLRATLLHRRTATST